MKRSGYMILGGSVAPARTSIGYDALTLRQQSEGIPSICATIVGSPAPARGLAAGVIELGAALFLPGALRVVVGGIGFLRILDGIWRIKGGAA